MYMFSFGAVCFIFTKNVCDRFSSSDCFFEVFVGFYCTYLFSCIKLSISFSKVFSLIITIAFLFSAITIINLLF